MEYDRQGLITISESNQIENVLKCKAYRLFRSIASKSSGWEKQIQNIVGSNKLEVIKHPNGFLKIRLCLFSDGSALRLHVWKPNSRANPHNHRWDFVSTVLMGELTETVLTENISEFSKKYSIHHYQHKKLRSIEKITSYCVKSLQRVSVGDIYFRQAVEIHSVETSNEKSISLVCTSPQIFDSQVIVLSSHGEPALDGSMTIKLEDGKNLIDKIIMGSKCEY